MSIISTDRLASLKAAAIEGIESFIDRAKRQQRQTVEIAAWNAEVEERKRLKRLEKQERKRNRKTHSIVLLDGRVTILREGNK